MSDKLTDLKPCPFCGSKAELLNMGEDFPHIVVCTNCGSAGATYETEQEAIEAWNKRS